MYYSAKFQVKEGGEQSMAFDLVRTFPSLRVPSFWDEDDELMTAGNTPSGLSVSEDEKNVFVETALPGVDPKDVEITFDKGILWVKGETQQEEKKKKYYRKATSAFSYRVAIPGDVDPNVEPEATCKNGVMTITFAKSPASQPKKIAVKSSK